MVAIVTAQREENSETEHNERKARSRIL